MFFKVIYPCIALTGFTVFLSWTLQQHVDPFLVFVYILSKGWGNNNQFTRTTQQFICRCNNRLIELVFLSFVINHLDSMGWMCIYTKGQNAHYFRHSRCICFCTLHTPHKRKCARQAKADPMLDITSNQINFLRTTKKRYPKATPINIKTSQKKTWEQTKMTTQLLATLGRKCYKKGLRWFLVEWREKNP